MIGVPSWVWVLAGWDRQARSGVAGTGRRGSGDVVWWRREQVPVPLSVRRAHQGRHWRGVSLAELRARWEREAAGPVEEWPTEQIPVYVEAAEPS